MRKNIIIQEKKQNLRNKIIFLFNKYSKRKTKNI